jgi:hypothetical protein
LVSPADFESAAQAFSVRARAPLPINQHMTFKSSGKLTYSPETHLRANKGWNRWLVLMCDEELGQYYRSLYQREFFYRAKLQRPVWGSHISTIRGETIQNHDIWGLGKDHIIQFEYEPPVQDNGEYYWLPVHCDELSAIREAYGLSREPRFGFHLSIGRTTNEN